MDFNLKNKMYNYKTGEYDIAPEVITDELAIQYIPQSDKIQKVYFGSRLAGMDTLRAMTEALSSHIGLEPGAWYKDGSS